MADHFVPRFVVRQQPENAAGSQSKPPHLAMEELRGVHAYVLLGDPGMGKTRVFAEEARLCGVTPVSADDFIDPLASPDASLGAPIFIDGLDEVRAGGGDPRAALRSVRSRLLALGRPRFRLACRAVDWLGMRDQIAMASALPTGVELEVCHLQPLTDPAVLTLLRDEPAVANAEDFVKQAERVGLSALLTNPQTLYMLVKAFEAGGRWPVSRAEAFEMACEQLANEPNIEHQAAKHANWPNRKKLLDAAGVLALMHLCADQAAFCKLAPSVPRCLRVGDIDAPRDLPLAEALETRLFTAIASDRFVPNHRSVAEFLAARYLVRCAGEGPRDGLPVGRALALMTGADGAVVSSLRGLHAWLAVRCSPADRARLLAADPLGVAMYGDVRDFSITEKTRLLEYINESTEYTHGLNWRQWNFAALGVLATPGMAPVFQRVLRSPAREDKDQKLARLVVEVLEQADALAGMGADLLALARDNSRQPATRRFALDAWLDKYAPADDEALELLRDIAEDRVQDQDDELLGALLRHLYPRALSPSAALRHLHRRKDEHLIGSYLMFWGQEFLEKTPNDRLPELLATLGDQTKAGNQAGSAEYWTLTSAAVARVILEFGDTSSDATLHTWLGIPLDSDGLSKLEPDDLKKLEDWFLKRPERYKSIVAYSLMNEPGSEAQIWRGASRLHGIKAPDDMGMFWLDMAEREMVASIATLYFEQAAYCTKATSSLETLEPWVNEHPGFRAAFEATRNPPIPEWQIANLERKRTQAAKDRERIEQYRQALTGKAPTEVSTHVLHYLAMAWLGHAIEARGDSPNVRLAKFFHADAALVDAALAALAATPTRSDLPRDSYIHELSLEGKTHNLCHPLVVGLSLAFDADTQEFERLGDDIHIKGLICQYAYRSGNDPQWLEHLVQTRPALVALAYASYAQAMVKARKAHVHGMHALGSDDNYALVSFAVIPSLLNEFPISANAELLHDLKYLLRAALRVMSAPDLSALVRERLALRGLDLGQRICWLTAGLLLEPKKYEATVRKQTSGQPVRIGHLGDFLQNLERRGGLAADMPASTLTLLIELLAPDSRPEWPFDEGGVTPAMDHADLVHGWINALSASSDAQVQQLLAQLETNPALSHWKAQIGGARATQAILLRDAAFVFPTPQQICATLAGGPPANAADLAAIVNDELAQLIEEIERGDLSLHRKFWNEDSHGRPVPNHDKAKSLGKPETSCRDLLAALLQMRLDRYGIRATPEHRQADDKRSDLWCSIHEFGVPIETKKQSTADLWKGLQSQLVARYSIDPGAQGHGIYLVFWFGPQGIPAPQSGAKPKTPAALKQRLMEQVSKQQEPLLTVHVIDLSLRGPPNAEPRSPSQIG